MTIAQAIAANPIGSEEAAEAYHARILEIVNAPVAKKIDLFSVRRLYGKYRIASKIESAKQLGIQELTDLCIDAQEFLKLGFDEEKVQLGEDHAQFMASVAGLVAYGVVPTAMEAEVKALAFTIPTHTLADIALERRRGTRDAKAAAASTTYNQYVAALDAAWQAGTDMDAVGVLEVVV